jgi:hypothetical protein
LTRYELVQIGFHGSSFTCASEPFVHRLPCGKRVRRRLLGETPKQLSAARWCEGCPGTVNRICRFSFLQVFSYCGKLTVTMAWAGPGIVVAHPVHIASPASAGGEVIVAIVRCCSECFACRPGKASVDLDHARSRPPPIETHPIYAMYLFPWARSTTVVPVGSACTGAVQIPHAIMTNKVAIRGFMRRSG